MYDNRSTVFLHMCFVLYANGSEDCRNCGSVEVKESYPIVVASANHLGDSEVNIAYIKEYKKKQKTGRRCKCLYEAPLGSDVNLGVHAN